MNVSDLLVLLVREEGADGRAAATWRIRLRHEHGDIHIAKFVAQHPLAVSVRVI